MSKDRNIWSAAVILLGSFVGLNIQVAQAGLVGGEALVSAHDQVVLANRASLTSIDTQIGKISFGQLNPHFELNFTPRNPGVSSSGRHGPRELGASSQIGGLGMSIGIAGGAPNRAATLYSAHNIQARLADRERIETSGGLRIGGALTYADWEIGSGYVQRELFGEATGLWSAHLGYSGMQAGVAFGQQETETELRNVMMFNTGIDASSWLKLYGDVAISQSEVDESIAVGRVGIRLNF